MPDNIANRAGKSDFWKSISKAVAQGALSRLYPPFGWDYFLFCQKAKCIIKSAFSRLFAFFTELDLEFPALIANIHEQLNIASIASPNAIIV